MSSSSSDDHVLCSIMVGSSSSWLQAYQGTDKHTLPHSIAGVKVLVGEGTLSKLK